MIRNASEVADECYGDPTVDHGYIITADRMAIVARLREMSYETPPHHACGQLGVLWYADRLEAEIQQAAEEKLDE